ncbi:MotA/TolQ/ExbB proton channel family protein [Pyxidicoccus parkwayensis]|uniref:MotA/TolQ/ExbB proton channel family protein n=1 Tax=Pyxidicoccus parkwayensis TaxID=2813578 RepID=A0ABX7NRX1_9BACT|nr:MotA/TolQ/ExbB proton channel family protein [Pyxidicoccus parkwaysis]QSQ21099.1 MotA/TolQ/ExbB proton channel family protein [Pyxidicoccus parkwaysis]
MNFNLRDIYSHMGVFALGIAWTLVLFAIASLAVFIERLFVFFRSRSISKRFAARAGPFLVQHQHEALVKEAEATKGSHLAMLLGGGMKTFLAKCRAPAGKLGPVELTRREMVRLSERVNADVRRGMSVLATVGSVAPFVGLLGTVVGIIEAFAGIAKEGSGGLGAVSAGIAEALVVTALGLLVAIPAVLMFNFLTTRADALQLSLDAARSEFMDYLEDLGAVKPTAANGAAVATGPELATHREGRDVRPA